MRLDKYLKVSRIIKRRTVAKEVADKGRIKVNGILAKNTGQKLSKIVKDTERDFFMSSAEAKEYGLVDKILEKSFK